jgi:hypothetical protein
LSILALWTDGRRLGDDVSTDYDVWRFDVLLKERAELSPETSFWKIFVEFQARKNSSDPIILASKEFHQQPPIIPSSEEDDDGA